MKVNSKNGKIKFEILFDKSSLEVFVNDGEQVLTTYVYPGKDSDLLSAFSFGGQTLIKSLKVWDMAK
jgi:levanase/fructan beta-fructosidase